MAIKSPTSGVRKEVLGIPAPVKAFDSAYSSKKCPFTGNIIVKKEVLRGKIVKRDVGHTATMEWERSVYVPKYERYHFKRSRLRVHNPPAVDAQIDDIVLVARCRPLSKTKHHIILSVVKQVASADIVAGQEGKGNSSTKNSSEDAV